MQNFFECCLEIILDTDINSKTARCKQLYRDYVAGIEFDWQTVAQIQSIPCPGRPDQPILVPPLLVPKRKMNGRAGHASLIHALAHIEFNAINLALDACYRYQQMPAKFYANWLQVASEETYHFELLSAHLNTLGYSYGAFSAHNGLWDMAVKTEHDPLARMGLVPRVLEARGIDAVPEMQKKLLQMGDDRGCEILAIIHQDEIKHVSFGDYWFKYLCLERNLEVEETFFNLMQLYAAPKIRGAFNRADRKRAGFSDQELDRLGNQNGETYV